MAVYRVEIGVDEEEGPSTTITITDEPGKTIEEQGLEAARELWPGREHFAIQTGEFDEAGVLKTEGSRPAWAPEAVVKVPEAKSPKEELREARKKVEQLEELMRSQATTCDHRWIITPMADSSWKRECTECLSLQRTSKTETKVLLVPVWEEDE